MLNRTIPPPSTLPKSVLFPDIDRHIMPNGNHLLIVNGGTEEVSRLDLLFNAGSRYQKQPLEARSSVDLLPEGAGQFTSAQISNHFDFYGSFLDFSYTTDFARLSVYSLNKHFGSTMEMLEQVVKQPTYPESELESWSSKGKQTLVVMMERASTLARRAFHKAIFGEQHPYGKAANPNDFDRLNPAQLHKFHGERFGAEGCTLILSGRVGDEQVKLTEKFFGTDTWGAAGAARDQAVDSSGINNTKVFIDKPNALQSAICIGRELFNRNHPDYPRMVILCTLLGGYFGSRLMKNIREDKGYSYGISSAMRFFRDSGYLVIATEVGAQYTKDTLAEIYKEIARLRDEPVGDDELNLVRSFLLGQTLRSISSPFSVADSTVGLYFFNNLDFSYYQRILDAIHTTTPEHIQELANRWLTDDALVECVAGQSCG